MSTTAPLDDLVVISDLHLWDPDEPRYHAAVDFLSTLPDEVDGLVVLGDLFDLWLGDNPLLARRFTAVVEALAAVRASGRRLLYCEGNHDLYVERFFPQQVGAETWTGARWLEVAGRRVHLSHGDLVNPGDRGYRFLRWLLRTPLVRVAARSLPARLPVAIGTRASHRSRAFTAGKVDPIRELSLAWADRRITEGADVVVIGHTHRPERVDRDAGGRRGVYVNTGLWLPDGTRWWARINARGTTLEHATGGVR